ncbi:MAG: RNA ligase family protein [Saprospiraceae bacterium]|nr:RNA ligase family protein [Saprospiraceae bacterium]
METLKYPRTYHFPFSLGATSDDRINDDWQNILPYELVLTEKLDGENTCIKSDGVYARSHGAPTRNPWAKNMWVIWEQIKNSLGDFDVFGENLYGLHSIEYTHLDNYFYVFAIREDSKWLSWDEVVFYAQILELSTVPVLGRGFFDENGLKNTINQTLQTGSKLGGECEGVVCRKTEAFDNEEFSNSVLKYVRKNHVKTDEHWTRNWQRAKLHFERTTH